MRHEPLIKHHCPYVNRVKLIFLKNKGTEDFTGLIFEKWFFSFCIKLLFAETEASLQMISVNYIQKGAQNKHSNDALKRGKNLTR